MRRTILLAGAILLAAAAVGAQSEPPPVPSVRPEQIIGEPAGVALTGAELERVTEELSSIIRCPVCQALSVADSPSDSALAMKDEVGELLALGYTEDQVLRYFEQAYGEFIRLEPKAKGFNLVVWLAPALFLLVGAGLVIARVVAGRSAALPPAESEPEDLDPYLDRVRREVGG